MGVRLPISKNNKLQKDARDCSEEYFGWKTDRFVLAMLSTVGFQRLSDISVYLVYGQASAQTVPAELESGCRLALLDGHFREK
jgi:hypothetical protein